MHVPDQEPLLWPRSLLHSLRQDSMGIPRIPRAGALFATFRIVYDQELREETGNPESSPRQTRKQDICKLAATWRLI